MTFDENHFVENARNYIAGAPDWNDHPPLGKLLIAGGILALGDNAIGWRIVPLLLGFWTILLAGQLARGVYPTMRFAPLIAMGLVGLDGLFVAYSRIAHLDGLLVAFYLAALVLMLNAKTAVRWALVFLVIACASSIKWSGITLLLPLAGMVWLRGVQMRPLLLTCWILPVTYVSLYSLGLWLTLRPASLADVWQVNQQLFAHHSALSGMTHAGTSYWYSWLYMQNPIVLRYDHVGGGRLAVMSAMGNPLLWLATTAVVMCGLVDLVRRREWLSRAPDQKSARWTTAQADFFLLLAWLAPILPWVVSDRDSYLYHYIPAYGAGLVLLAGRIARWRQRAVRTADAFLGAALLISVYFAPIWTQWPISPGAFNQRMWFESWR